jgi:ComF family protein
LKRAIAALKYEKKPQLGEILGDLLAQSWLQSGLNQSNLLVIPIPMHPKKQQERGYNQADLLAESFCNMTGLKLLKSGLSRVIDTAPLYQESSIKNREQILKGAFQIGKNLLNKSPKYVLLLDDIYTTGSTIKEAEKVLNQAGIKVYGTVAIATSRK